MWTFQTPSTPSRRQKAFARPTQTKVQPGPRWRRRRGPPGGEGVREGPFHRPHPQRKALLLPDWFHLVGLLHDLGKVLALAGEPQVRAGSVCLSACLERGLPQSQVRSGQVRSLIPALSHPSGLWLETLSRSAAGPRPRWSSATPPSRTTRTFRTLDTGEVPFPCCRDSLPKFPGPQPSHPRLSSQHRAGHLPTALWAGERPHVMGPRW